MFSGIGSGMLGLEMPLHPQQQQNPQNSQNPHHLHPHSQMVSYAHHDAEHHQQPQQNVKQGFQFVAKSTNKQASPLSDEDEAGFDDGTGDGKRKISPWQRMKWTDSMVRLLIMAVYYIGDEAGSEGNDPSGKKKAGGLLQKKGKWKSVSRAMMEKGFYVSPQQCEDKFNDLNKRYKRVNDILGKGTACRVVENQSLLDTMDLAPKMKEEVRKLLNSKHLFFREMCAYHNSCNHGAGAGTSGANHSPDVAAEPLQIQHPQGQQLCLHSSDNAQNGANSSRIGSEGSKLGTKVHSDEDDDEEEDDSDQDEDDEETEGHSRGQSGHGHDDDDENDEKPSRKRPRQGPGPAPYPSLSPILQQFRGELGTMMQDGSKSAWEKKQWMKVRLMQLEEQQVSYRYQAFELEKQRLKWIKFSSKKEREMERAKLENERRRLENERMVLLVRQKEVELLQFQHQHQPQQLSSSKRGDPSSVTG